MSVRVIVAAHKAYQMPTDPMYLPLHVGKAGKDLDLGFQGDNTGDNISEKNGSYCELTGIYWAWKNLDCDLGLAHYRRHFKGTGKGKDKFDSVLSGQEAEALLKTYPVLVPNKRKYYIETNYSHYIHAHPAEGLDMAFSYISAQSERYKKAVETVKNRTWAHMFNMFIMRREILDGYCPWLFDVLAHVEENLDTTGYSAYDSRVYGFISELLLDVYLEANGISYHEVPVMFMEKQNWLKKGGAFLKRKIVGH